MSQDEPPTQTADIARTRPDRPAEAAPAVGTGTEVSAAPPAPEPNACDVPPAPQPTASPPAGPATLPAPDSVVETWTAPSGSPLPKHWTLDGDALRRVEGPIIADNRFSILGVSPDGEGEAVIAYPNIVAAEDVDQKATYFMNANAIHAGFIARRADADPDTYYLARGRTSAKGVELVKVIDGKKTVLARGAGDRVVPGAVELKMRFTAMTVGKATRLGFKVWLADQSEPAAFMVSASDAEPRLQGVAGRFGIYFGVFPRRRMWSDDYEAKLNGSWDERIVAVAPTPEERKRLMAQCAAMPAADGFYLSLDVLLNLVEHRSPDRTIPKKLAAVGGVIAGSRVFDRAVGKELARVQGYAFASKSGLAGRDVSVLKVRKVLLRRLEREKPEVVRILFDVTELLRGRRVEDLKTDLGDIVRTTLEFGAIPVLFTLAVPRTVGDSRVDKLVIEYNATVLKLASDMKVPCVDTFGILNSNVAGTKRLLGPKGAVTAHGLDAVNEKFLILYRILERWVMSRGRARP